MPSQIALLPDITGTGLAFMVTSCDVLPIHPLASVTVTVYVPPKEGLIDAALVPSLHRYETNPGVALSEALNPWQAANVPLMDGVGFAFMVTTCDTDPVHPLASVTVTV